MEGGELGSFCAGARGMARVGVVWQGLARSVGLFGAGRL